MQQKTNNNATYTENKLLDHNYQIPDLVQDILRKTNLWVAPGFVATLL